MKIGECRRAATGQPYCRGNDGKVRFVPVTGFSGMGAMGMPIVAGGGSMTLLPGLAGGSKRGKGRKMKTGECRRTRQGVKYCKTKKGVRFRRG